MDFNYYRKQGTILELQVNKENGEEFKIELIIETIRY